MINIQLIDMPCKVKATHTMNDDGSFSVFINSRLNIEQQLVSYLHELKHIENEDLLDERTASHLEYIRHKEV